MKRLFFYLCASTLVNENYALLTGDLTNTIEFNLNFEGDITETLAIDLLFWEGGVGGQFQGGINLFYLGDSSWGSPIGFTPNNPYDRTVDPSIPEPNSALLFVAGALVIATRTSRGRR